MKLVLALLAGAFLFLPASLRADPFLQPHDMVAICGDSITEQIRYSVFLEDYFLMCKPVEGLQAAQFGWGGQSAGGFFKRIDSDLVPFRPTLATLCYGMNDGQYLPMNQQIGDTYRQSMTASVEKLKAVGARAVIVGSPTCVDEVDFKKPLVTAAEYNQTLDALRGIAQEVAQKENVGFADIHTLMMEVKAKAKAAYGPEYQFIGGEGVHPDNLGHLVIAYAFLKAFGCDGAIGTITVDLQSGTAEGTPRQRIVSMQNGTVEVESTRYPFCFLSDPKHPDRKVTDILNFFPFNEDLNRYLLIVKGLKGCKAKVKWGTESREFSAHDLAKGVNLATEFIQNPFCSQFGKVNSAVWSQQNFEISLVKAVLHHAPAVKTPEWNATAANGIAKEKARLAAATALVIPLHHTIRIEPET